MGITWKDLKEELTLSEDEKEAVRLEEKLIATMIHIREDKGMSQAQLAKVCHMKQPAIARMEKRVHSPQVDSLLKILVPLGYTLEIVPIKK
ncbi:MAG: XRE family transcriptional regulator [Lachnospiraceae bacterium]|nr:XRE family transcriptional regulator [Lachnospiraceae bacterium]